MEKLRLHIGQHRIVSTAMAVIMIFGFLMLQAPIEVMDMVYSGDSAHAEWPISDSESESNDHKEEMDDKDEFESTDLNPSSSHYSNDLFADYALHIRSVDLPLYSPPPEFG